jgi:hypothetical protein
VLLLGFALMMSAGYVQRGYRASDGSENARYIALGAGLRPDCLAGGPDHQIAVLGLHALVGRILAMT